MSLMGVFMLEDDMTVLPSTARNIDNAVNKALRRLEQLRKNLPKPTALDLAVLYLKRNAG